jgi:hypothetical protein
MVCPNPCPDELVPGLGELVLGLGGLSGLVEELVPVLGELVPGLGGLRVLIQ